MYKNFQNLINKVDNSLNIVRPIDFEGTCRAGEKCLVPWATPGFFPSHYKHRTQETKRDFDLYSLGASFYNIVTKKYPPKDGKIVWSKKLTKLPTAVLKLIEDLLSDKTADRPEADIMSKKIKSLINPHEKELLDSRDSGKKIRSVQSSKVELEEK